MLNNVIHPPPIGTTLDRVSYILAVNVQAILFGVYLVTLGFCLRWLLYDEEGWKVRKKFDWLMLITTVVLWIFSTADIILSIQVALRYDQSLNDKFNEVIGMIEMVSPLIVDAILIYRCWVVYARSWGIVCLPLLTWLATFAVVIAIAYCATNPASRDQQFVVSLLVHLVEAFLACNIATNILATSFILYRIRKFSSVSGSGHRLDNVFCIIAESGLLYTVSSALNLVGHIVGVYPNLVFFFNLTTAINFPLGGIAFNLILIRVGQNRASSTHVVQGSFGEASQKGRKE